MSEQLTELLLCWARMALDDRAVSHRQRLLNEDQDWRGLIGLAAAHGLAPLLYHNLRSSGWGTIPDCVRRDLKQAYMANACWSLHLTHELQRLLKAFAAEGISAVPFKGPVVAALAYKDPALRCFGDLDFIVRQGDLTRAREVLLKHGYEPELTLTDDQVGDYIRHDCEYGFGRVRDRTVVELHWRFSQRSFYFLLDPVDLWKRLTEVQLAEQRVTCFSPEDTLLLLCVHGARHYWSLLKWVCDIEGLIHSHPSLGWSTVFQLAKKAKVERALLLGLALTRDLLGVSLPRNVETSVLADQAVARLCQDVRERLADPVPLPGVLRRVRFLLALQNGWAPKTRQLCLLLSSPTGADWQALSLPPSLGFLFPAVRVVRIVRAEVSAAWRSRQ